MNLYIFYSIIETHLYCGLSCLEIILVRVEMKSSFGAKKRNNIGYNELFLSFDYFDYFETKYIFVIIN